MDNQTKAPAKRGSSGKQQAAAAPAAGSQGATGAAPAEKKKVTIEEFAIPPRGGRLLAEETWPFGDLTPATKNGDDIKGPSFFIPEAENPDAALASARKRHKGVSFISRKMTGPNDAGETVEGVRVWRAPA